MPHTWEVIVSPEETTLHGSRRSLDCCCHEHEEPSSREQLRRLSRQLHRRQQQLVAVVVGTCDLAQLRQRRRWWPIYKDGDVIGRATGGGFGWRMNKSLALAMVHPSQSDVGNDLEIEILGKRYKCRVLEDSPHDPTNEKLRS